LSAQFRRLAARQDKKRVIVVLGHTILVIVFHMFKNLQPYRDFGANYFDRRNAEQLKQSLVRRLERLGVQMSIVSTAPAFSRESHVVGGWAGLILLISWRNESVANSWRAAGQTGETGSKCDFVAGVNGADIAGSADFWKPR